MRGYKHEITVALKVIYIHNLKHTQAADSEERAISQEKWLTSRFSEPYFPRKHQMHLKHWFIFFSSSVCAYEFIKFAWDILILQSFRAF